MRYVNFDRGSSWYRRYRPLPRAQDATGAAKDIPVFEIIIKKINVSSRGENGVR